ncbi:MAG: type II secretion system F family protein [Candidatus Acidiferrales bacterium]
MLWIVTSATFLATVGLLVALVYAFTPSDQRVAGRLARILNSSSAATERVSQPADQTAWLKGGLASIGKLVPAGGASQVSRSQLLMIRAGYRSPDAMLAMRGFKILAPVALLSAVVFTGLYHYNPTFIIGAAAVLGFLLPDMWLTSRVRARQNRLRMGLPDGLDLLVICVEVGLGLDQALLRVAQELQVAHPELSEELQLVNLEMRVGKSRIEALRSLARRTGLEDIKALVAMLVQTERFGTSVAQSLRIHSDDLRTRRRQRAEEMSAKTTVKMVPALVLFIFPALLVVILGPAILTLMRQFVH